MKTSRFAVRGALLLVAVVAAAWLLSLLPGSLNPFRTKDVDRSSAVVVKSISDLGEYRAATANLQLVVDLEKDTRFVPGFIKGERTLFIASGTVDAGVDFSALAPDAITVDEDRRSASLSLPAVRLYRPQVDLEQSYVADRNRGLVDRIGALVGDGGDEKEVYELAERKLREGAEQDDRLMTRAQGNVQQMLKSLLGSLGFTEVAVTFAELPAS